MTILYGSGISNCNQHSGDNLPLLLMGGGAGRLKGGRHLAYTDKPSMANLLVTLMDKMDVPVERLGGSTGRLADRHGLAIRQTAMRKAQGTRHKAKIAFGSFCASTVCLMPLLFAAERPAVIDAARNRDHAVLRALIQKKVDVNQTEADGATALHWAAYRDDLESVDLLVAAGANVNAANDLGATPLWNAGTNAGEPVTKRLLDAGANPNLALLAGETPLMAAARAGKAGVAELLLAKGANPNARGSRGQTALMWAVSGRHPAVVKALLAHRADVHARSAEWKEMVAVPPHGLPQYNKIIPQGGDTAMLFAARVGDLESAKLLAGAGASVNDADAWGVSATVIAAHAGFTELVEWLLDRGADPNAAAAGFTAMHAAIMAAIPGWSRPCSRTAPTPMRRSKHWTPTRRSSRDHNFAPELVGATPFWLAPFRRSRI